MLQGGVRALRARYMLHAALQRANLRHGWDRAYMPALSSRHVVQPASQAANLADQLIS